MATKPPTSDLMWFGDGNLNTIDLSISTWTPGPQPSYGKKWAWWSGLKVEFPWGYPFIAGWFLWTGKSQSKYMIWGYPHFRKPPYILWFIGYTCSFMSSMFQSAVQWETYLCAHNDYSTPTGWRMPTVQLFFPLQCKAPLFVVAVLGGRDQTSLL